MRNLGKSLFISAFSGYTMVVAAAALIRIIRDPGPEAMAWAGVALVHLPMAMLFARLLLLRDRARTHAALPVISALTAAGFVASVVSSFTVSPAPGAPLAWAALGGAAYLVYLLWYSRFSRRPAATLEPGGKLPRLTFATPDGGEFDTAALAGAPAIVLFYRGNWCPLCMAQIKEIAAEYRELAARGVEVLLISPQPQSKSQRLARQFDAPMRFLVDPGNRVARQLGIDCPHGLPAGMQLLGYASETVLPTVVVIDSAGTILLADQTDNYRVRPEPATFIEALDAAQR